jgi:hypothetical protein
VRSGDPARPTTSRREKGKVDSAPRGALRLLLLCAACLTPSACNPPIRQYDLKNQPLTCPEANRYAYRTVKAMGFSASRFDPAQPGRPGEIRGRRERPGASGGEQRIAVRVTCTPNGADIDAREEGSLDQITLKRGFHHSFTNIVSMTEAEEHLEEQIDAGTAPPSQQRHDLQVLVEPVRGQGAKLDFDFDLAAAGVLPVRVEINNWTSRGYTLEPDRIRLQRKDRRRVDSIPPAEVAERVVGARDPDSGEPVTDLPRPAVLERLRERVFSAHEIAPGDKVEGYLYFPLAEYLRARVVLTEGESGEVEGFLVEF